MTRRLATPAEVAAYTAANRAFTDLVRRTRQLLGCTVHAARDHILARGGDRTNGQTPPPFANVTEYFAHKGIHVTAKQAPTDPTRYYVYD